MLVMVNIIANVKDGKERYLILEFNEKECAKLELIMSYDFIISDMIYDDLESNKRAKLSNALVLIHILQIYTQQNNI